MTIHTVYILGISCSLSLLKGVALHRVLYQSILNAKLTGRKNLGRKRCTSNRDLGVNPGGDGGDMSPPIRGLSPPKKIFKKITLCIDRCTSNRDDLKLENTVKQS